MVSGNRILCHDMFQACQPFYIVAFVVAVHHAVVDVVHAASVHWAAVAAQHVP